jgi:hypothetical protein
MARILVFYGTATGHTTDPRTLAEDFGRRVASEASRDHAAATGSRVA